VDATTIQARVMTLLGEVPTDRDLQRAFGTLISDTSALRSLVSLDRPQESWLTDDDVALRCGGLAVALCEACCALGVDLGEAFERGVVAAEERIRSRAALLEQRRAAMRGAG